ncbi:MAG: HEAT repeat domain-containing protein [Sedimentisphaerales bacterium]|nr:HEAT repeat domain-containing protein [Sedimentisphaerales bacterium]
MRKQLFITLFTLCFICSVSSAISNNYKVDSLQETIYGVSTLKGVKLIYPQVIISIREGNNETTGSSFQIGLDSRKIESEIMKTLIRAGFLIADGLNGQKEDSPLYLNVTITIRTDDRNNSIYPTFITTEALQYVKLNRENSIGTFNRTWPMFPYEITRNLLLLEKDTLVNSINEEVTKQVQYFVNDLVAANPKPITRTPVEVDIAALRKTLFEDASELRGTFRVRNENPKLQAIEKLESSGSDEAVSLLLEFLTDNRKDRLLKHHALTSLGRIGTESAIEAINKFERWSQRRYTNPLPLYMGPQESAIDHVVAMPMQPLAQTKDKNGKTWAIIPLYNFYKIEPGLTSLMENDQWSEPILLNFPDMPEPRRLSETALDTQYKLQVDGDSIKITSNDKTYETTISEQIKDTDNDGLPDTIEARMKTDPKNPDSDGDSIADGKDSNPLTPKHKETNDTTEIRQAVFSVLFATTSSRNTVIIVDRDEFAKQEYYGFAGPVLRLAEHIEGFVNVTSIDIRYQSEDAATVNISDHEASMAASMHEAKLQKIHGKWVVVEFRLTLIS